MELKTPDLISTAPGKMTGGERQRYLRVWFSFCYFPKAEEVHEPHTRNVHVAATNLQVYVQCIHGEHIRPEST